MRSTLLLCWEKQSWSLLSKGQKKGMESGEWHRTSEREAVRAGRSLICLQFVMVSLGLWLAVHGFWTSTWKVTHPTVLRGREMPIGHRSEDAHVWSSLSELEQWVWLLDKVKLRAWLFLLRSICNPQQAAYLMVHQSSGTKRTRARS